MSSPRTIRIRRCLVAALAVGAVFGGALYEAGVFHHDRGGPGEARPAGEPASTADSEAVTSRATSRLREDAKQVTDPITARAVAREALRRVETELASAREKAEVERLERKRRLVLEAIGRLGNGSPDP